MAAPHVGTLGEKPLHAALKRWYAGADDGVEVPVDGYVIDLVSDGVLVEIQTGNFSAMKRKLARLLERHTVRLVHPVASQKWIVKTGAGCGVTSRRRSPKRGMAADVFAELVSFPELVAHNGFTLEVLLIHEEEVRRFDGRRAWRRKGWVIDERRLVDVVDRLVVDAPRDLAAWLPAGLPERFTTADLAQAFGRPRRLAQQAAYCLRRLGLLQVVDKQGNTNVYARTVA